MERKLGLANQWFQLVWVIADRKATLGVMGQFDIRVYIKYWVCYFDFGSPKPRNTEVSKGRGVHSLNRFVSWVQTVVRQVCFYLSIVYVTERWRDVVREENFRGANSLWVIRQSTPSSHALLDKHWKHLSVKLILKIVTLWAIITFLVLKQDFDRIDV